MLSSLSPIHKTSEDGYLSPRWSLDDEPSCGSTLSFTRYTPKHPTEPSEAFQDFCAGASETPYLPHTIDAWRPTYNPESDRCKYVSLRGNRKQPLSPATVLAKESFTKQYIYGHHVDNAGTTLTNGISFRKEPCQQDFMQTELPNEPFPPNNCSGISPINQKPRIISHGGADDKRGGTVVGRGLSSGRKSSLAPSVSGSQRSHSHDLSEEDSEDEDGEGSRREKGKGRDTDTDSSFACPYARGDRATYERCVFRSFPTLRKLRIHLHNTHFKLFKSEECDHRAGTRAELARHLKTKGHIDNPQRCPADSGLPSLKEAESLFDQVKMRSSSSQTWSDIFRLLHPNWNYPFPKDRYVQYSAFVDCFPFTPGEYDIGAEHINDIPMSDAPRSGSSPSTVTIPRGQQATNVAQEVAFLRSEVLRLTGELANKDGQISSLMGQVAFLLKFYDFYEITKQQDPERIQAFERERAQGHAFLD